MSVFFDGATAPGIATLLTPEPKEPGGVLKVYHGLTGAAELRGPPRGHHRHVEIQLHLYEAFATHAALLEKLVEIDGWQNTLHGDVQVVNFDADPTVNELFEHCTFLGLSKLGPYRPPGGTIDSWQVPVMLRFRQLLDVRS